MFRALGFPGSSGAELGGSGLWGLSESSRFGVAGFGFRASLYREAWKTCSATVKP